MYKGGGILSIDNMEKLVVAEESDDGFWRDPENDLILYFHKQSSVQNILLYLSWYLC